MFNEKGISELDINYHGAHFQIGIIDDIICLSQGTFTKLIPFDIDTPENYDVIADITNIMKNGKWKCSVKL